MKRKFQGRACPYWPGATRDRYQVRAYSSPACTNMNTKLRNTDALEFAFAVSILLKYTPLPAAKEQAIIHLVK